MKSFPNTEQMNIPNTENDRNVSTLAQSKTQKENILPSTLAFLELSRTWPAHIGLEKSRQLFLFVITGYHRNTYHHVHR